jgi:hypothetical protein
MASEEDFKEMACKYDVKYMKAELMKEISDLFVLNYPTQEKISYSRRG